METFRFNTTLYVCKELNQIPTSDQLDAELFTKKYPKSRIGIKKFDKCYTKYGSLNFITLNEDKHIKFERLPKGLVRN